MSKAWKYLVGVVLLFALVFGIRALVENNHQKRLENDYSKAITLFKNDALERATQAFSALGDYKDAVNYIQKCEVRRQELIAREMTHDGDFIGAKAYLQLHAPQSEYIAYCEQAIRYQEADRLMNAGSYNKALPILQALQESNFHLEYESANWLDLLIEQCTIGTELQVADALYAAGDLDAAYEAYLALGIQMDAQAKAEAVLADKPLADFYTQAEIQQSKDNWTQAYKLFVKARGYRDAENRAQAIGASLYQQAETALASAQFQRAFDLFSGILDYSDALARQTECIQPTPSTCVINSAENPGSGVSLNIDNTDSNVDIILLMRKQDTIIYKVFIRQKESFIIRFAPGDYEVYVYTGAIWFGDQEEFGDPPTFLYGCWQSNNFEKLRNDPKNFTLTDSMIGLLPEYETYEGYHFTSGSYSLTREGMK